MAGWYPGFVLNLARRENFILLQRSEKHFLGRTSTALSQPLSPNRAALLSRNIPHRTRIINVAIKYKHSPLTPHRLQHKYVEGAGLGFMCWTETYGRNQPVVFRNLVWNTTKTFRNPSECSIGLINMSIYYWKRVGVQFVRVIKKKNSKLEKKIDGPRLTVTQFGVVKFGIGKIGDLNI